jgi:hypothetical protein
MGNAAAGTEEDALAAKLVQLVVNSLRDDKGVRAEDAICVLATVVGERCIDAAGDYDLRRHTLTPGSRVFSDQVNYLVSGDVASADLAEISASSVVGILRDRLVGRSYDRADFPALSAVFRGFAAKVGTAAAWGTVPLSVPERHQPSLIPLRIGYETRPAVDKVLSPLGGDKQRILRTAVLALAQLLEAVRQAIDPKIALRLALELVNGMAKTAPMTEAALYSSPMLTLLR